LELISLLGHDGPVSPVSRGRKRPKSRSTGLRVVRPAQPVEPEPCDCPACTGEDFDPQELIDDLIGGGTELLAAEDALEVEIFGAGFAAAGFVAGGFVADDSVAGESVGDGFGMAETIVQAVEAAATPEALAVLLSLDSVDFSPGAAESVHRLTAHGVPTPAWVDELRAPVRVSRCQRVLDPAGDTSVLLCAFDRAGSSHGFVIYVDDADCHAAADILLVAGEAIDEVTEALRVEGTHNGVELHVEALDPAEFRWQVERALDARAVHDEELDEDELAEDLGDDEGPGYLPMAVLLRARILTLPEPTRPPEEHGSSETAQLAADIRRFTAKGSGAQPKLPPKRKKSNGTAPIYQLKISLAGAKPPIWRRLEVPGDTSLATLHDIIQAAFNWSDTHIHAFETSYGDFGVADQELGYRAEKPVTLEQVAAGEGSRLEYTYDFGDNWTHEIVVEKVQDREPVAEYPRCVGGRRAAPPEDCGGIWGYQDLIEIMADPNHPDHADRLEWLGLESADEFKPTQFTAAEITEALTRKR
jgi:hypothetical protein